MLKSSLCVFVLCAACAFGQAEGKADNPLSKSVRDAYGFVKMNVTKAAAKMPDENYSYKPTPEVRSFGQLVGHVSNANYMFCSAVLGEKSSAPNIEKTKTTKAELVEALNASFQYCDKAYDALTDANATDPVKIMGGERPKLSALSFNSMHDIEHYGNMITYLRLKGIVPPSSEPRPAATADKK